MIALDIPFGPLDSGLAASSGSADAGLLGCLFVGMALLLWPGPGPLPRTASRRSSVRGHHPDHPAGPGGRRMPPRVRRFLLCTTGVLAIGVLIGAGPLPLALASGLAAVAGRWLPVRDEPGLQGRRGRGGHGLAGAAPLLDLLATALESGLPMPRAISAATCVDDSEAAGVLRETGQLLSLGAPPADAWRPVALHGDLAPVAAVAVRSAIGGTTVADAARSAAADIRGRARTAAERTAARAEVAMTAPLALCFLPAFLCLGLAPVVIGLISGLHLF